jgi:hypothetical protein
MLMNEKVLETLRAKAHGHTARGKQVEDIPFRLGLSQGMCERL